MSATAVELKSVIKVFATSGGNSVAAVDDVSLQILDGEFFSLLGPSGCGKTTTLRMIAGFELPTAGDIFIHGKAMGETPPHKRPVNTVFQSYALFPHMTIFQNVAFGLEMDKIGKDEIRRRVGEALEMVRLPGMEDRKPKQLSGGQQQRVALARALVKRPEVLLLDEPLGALDQKLRKEMQLELKKLQREVGITFVFVTHDQEEALTMSDRIAVMHGGQVLQTGNSSEIYDQPNSRFVAEFIGETNFLPATVTAQEDDAVTVALAGDVFCRTTAPGPVAPGQAVTIAIRPEKLHLHGMRQHVVLPEEYVRMSGQVSDVVYIGTDTHYDIQLDGPAGTRVRVREQNSDPISRLMARPGDALVVSFPPQAARVLAE